MNYNLINSALFTCKNKVTWSLSCVASVVSWDESPSRTTELRPARRSVQDDKYVSSRLIVAATLQHV